MVPLVEEGRLLLELAVGFEQLAVRAVLVLEVLAVVERLAAVERVLAQVRLVAGLVKRLELAVRRCWFDPGRRTFAEELAGRHRLRGRRQGLRGLYVRRLQYQLEI